MATFERPFQTEEEEVVENTVLEGKRQEESSETRPRVQRETSSVLEEADEATIEKKTLTAKEKIEQLRSLKYRQTAALSAITKKRNELCKLMTDKNYLDLVKHVFSEFKNACVYWRKCFSVYFNNLISDEDREYENIRRQNKETSIIEFESEVQIWISDSENNLVKESDSISNKGSNVSHKSKSSKGSSVKSALVKEKAKLAELLAEKSMLEQTQKLHELELNIKIAKSQAREKVFTEAEKNTCISSGSKVKHRKSGVSETGPCLNPSASTFIPMHHDASSEQYCRDKSLDLSENLERQHEELILQTHRQMTTALLLPHLEVPKFNGDPTEFGMFMRAFDARIVPHTSSSTDRLYYLEQQLEGEPKHLISGCMYMDADQGYQRARHLLMKEYGDPYKVATTYINRILAWPDIKHDDSFGLRQFSIYLTKCLSVMSSISYMTVLNHAPNMQAVVKKLPTYLQNKWRDLVVKKRLQGSVDVVFEDIVSFIEFAAESANEPVYSKKALCQFDQVSKSFHLQSTKHVKTFSNKPKMNSFATGADNHFSPRAQNRFIDRKLVCHFCKNGHETEDCKWFAQKTLEERRSFLKDKNMCFGCLGFNHISKGCLKKRTCKKCMKRHPTLLHDDNFQRSLVQIPPTFDFHDVKGKDSNELRPESGSVLASCNVAKSDDMDTIWQSILPVQIHQKGSTRVVTTYALLDNGSTGCFITDSLSGDLQVTCVPSNLKLKTMHGVNVVQTSAVSDLIITDINGEHAVQLPKTFMREEIPVGHRQIPDPSVLQHLPHLKPIQDKLFECCPDLHIGLLIGSNCPLALEPLQVIQSQGNGPFAVRYRHGWTICGPVHLKYDCQNDTLTCNQVLFCDVSHVKETLEPSAIVNMFEMDFSERDCGNVPGELGCSRDDQMFLSMVEQKTKFVDGHFEIPLPFRDTSSVLLNNKNQAVKRAMWQRKKMLQNEQYYKDYVTFMDNLLAKGYAYKVPEDDLIVETGKVRYLPHHGVYHPKKPNKIRVVFDCSAEFQNCSLNDVILQGPNLTNLLLGVLTRFRSEHVAFIADIEAMFYQVKVPKDQHDFLRFLWWPGGDLDADLHEYRMAVHIFGAVSSPSISNFALRLTATKAEKVFGHVIAEAIRRNFYVDDCLKSVPNDARAVKLVKDLICACSDGGFKLTKFASNSRSLLKALPSQDHSKEVQTCDLDYDDLPTERALGMLWNVTADTFTFLTDLPNKPLTRRGILSTVSSLYDPLGLVSPVILPAKKLLRGLCMDKSLNWDDEISLEDRRQWDNWMKDLQCLQKLSIERCTKPMNFGDVTCQELHVFSDASSLGYGCSAYLRQCTEKDVHVSLLVGKSRLAPIKTLTIPRLELTAATVAVRIGQVLMQELDLSIDSVVYYTDSMTVLHYIKNEKRRFPVFVTNRVRTIRDFSTPDQWRYVETSENPADVTSRGSTASQILECEKWFSGPVFLRELDLNQRDQFCTTDKYDDSDDDVITTSVQASEAVNNTNTLLHYFSSWYRLTRAVAIYRRLFQILKFRVRKRLSNECEVPQFSQDFTVTELDDAEKSILKVVQAQTFSAEISALCTSSDERGRVSKHSSVYKLSPFMRNELLCVGGRLRNADVPEERKHQILLPRTGHVIGLIIRDMHERLGHAGRNHVVSSLRERYWIVSTNSAVRGILSKCTVCRRFNVPTCEQKMADLPASRVNPSPPFSHTGVDLFGPHVIKEGRKYVKRYGALFTCFASRAVHLETTNSLDTDSFINALRRFIARRGPVREITCDNGTNFVSDSKELRQAVDHMDQSLIKSYLLKHAIAWHFNPPAASHMGGVWERLIKSVRKIISPLLLEFGDRLDDESYRTLLCEVEAIVNSRPLTTASNDVDDLNPLTPNHLLMMKSNVVIPPPGQFQRDDMYMRKRWRQIQYLSDIFWTRWKREYLQSLQERQKWNAPKRNLREGDIVLIKDENAPRSVWNMGRVTRPEPDNQGFVRSVNLRTQNGVLRRPANKLVLLLTAENADL